MGTLKQFRKLVVQLQGGRCAYCFRVFRMDREKDRGPFFWTHPRAPTLDHVVPKSLGGPNRGNVVAVHAHCNNAKGGRAPTGCELIALEWVRGLVDAHRLAHPED